MFVNISIDHDFLLSLSNFYLSLRCDNYIIYLPNNRSCRTFYNILKKIITEKNLTIMMPKIKSYQDMFYFDSNTLSILVLNALSKHKDKFDISLDTLVNLSNSVANFIKQMTILNITLEEIETYVPNHLENHWNITSNLLKLCLTDKVIEDMLLQYNQKINLNLEVFNKSKQNTIIAGISDLNFHFQNFIQIINKKDNNYIVLCGANDGVANNQLTQEQCDILNVQLNTIVEVVSKCDQNVSRETSTEFAEFNNEFEEAIGIACAVKKAISQEKTVLIVCQDQSLSEKIKYELQKWNIIADNSSGFAFGNKPEGILVGIALDFLKNSFDITYVFAMLKTIAELYEITNELDLMINKQDSYIHDIYDLVRFLKNNDKFASVLHVLNAIIEKINNFKNTMSLTCFLKMHEDVISILNLESASEFFNICSPFVMCAYNFQNVTIDEYAVFIKNNILTHTMRTSIGFTKGVMILGLIEAQLISADYIIITSANENTWSPSDANDFLWIKKILMHFNTEHKQELFIKSIFERLVAKPNVLITRSKKINTLEKCKYHMLDTISYKSADWLQKLVEYITMQTQRNIKKIIAPNPDVEYRPKSLSVSDIRLLINEPYSFYAKKILKLQNISKNRNMSTLKGIFIHKVLERYVRNQYNIEDHMQYVMNDMFLKDVYFGIDMFNLSKVFAYAIENIHSQDVHYAEVKGIMKFPIDCEKFITIKCNADRIDVLNDGTMRIIDYKCGAIASKINIIKGLDPQLPLEGIIASNNGFMIKNQDDTSNIDVAELQIWSLKSKNCKIISIDNLSEVLNTTNSGIKSLLKSYITSQTPFYINEKYAHYKEYFHLARIYESYDYEE